MTERALPGTGTISPLPSGRFRLRLTLANGKRESAGVYATEAEAARVRDAILTKMAKEKLAPVGGVTLREYGKSWLERRERLGGRDVRNDWSRWRTHIGGTWLADIPVTAITRADVRHWLDELRMKDAADVNPGPRRQARRIGNQTIKNALNLLRVCLEHALEYEVIKVNPARDVKAPREAKTEDAWTFLRPDEQARLLHALPEPERHMVAFAMYTGLREGEQRALRLADIHLDELAPNVHIRYGGTPRRPTKTGKRRTVYLLPAAVDALRSWLAALPARTPWNPHQVVFPGVRGGFRHRGHILEDDVWATAMKGAGIVRNVRWHDLRHTCGSSLVAGWWGRVWSLLEVRDHLGHGSVTTTERYAHLAPSVLAQAAAGTGGGGRPPTDTPRTPDDLTMRDAIEPIRFPKPKVADSISAGGADIRDLRVTAAMLLRRASAKDWMRVNEVAVDLAEGVLALQDVRLALDVLDGGPHLVRRATELAELILKAPLVTFVESLDGAGDGLDAAAHHLAEGEA